MLSLHTNIAALSTQRAVSSTQSSLTTSLTRLGTGLRVNSAIDDAAGLQIATRLNAQTRGMAVASRNTQNGISLLQTAEGSLAELSEILLRMKDLATEAFTASATATDQDALQAEYDALGREMTNIMKNSNFGGEKLFDVGVDDAAITAGTSKFGKTGGIVFQTGASADETLELDLSAKVAALGSDTGSLGTLSETYVTTATAATIGTELTAGTNAILTSINDALDTLGEVRSAFGATANRLDHVYNNLQNISTNTEAAKGRIMDVDYASESANQTAKQLQLQAGTLMLKQASQVSQLVLSLLQ